MPECQLTSFDRCNRSEWRSEFEEMKIGSEYALASLSRTCRSPRKPAVSIAYVSSPCLKADTAITASRNTSAQSDFCMLLRCITCELTRFAGRYLVCNMYLIWYIRGRMKVNVYDMRHTRVCRASKTTESKTVPICEAKRMQWNEPHLERKTSGVRE